MNRVYSLEERFNNYKTSYLFTFEDTVFLATDDETFFIDKDFNLRKYEKVRRIYGNFLYDDSSYYVYACCAGEFGGSVFFRDKATNKTYSYFATCARQVVRFKGQYVVCNNLAHLGRSMSFLFVPNPQHLYELKEEKMKNHCNWYVDVDSLKNRGEINPTGGVKSNYSYDLMSLVSFGVGDSLYSVVCSDTSTFIAVHKNDTVFERQRLFNRTIDFHDSRFIQAGRKLVCLFNLSEGSPFAAYLTRGRKSGMVVIDGNNIDFLDVRQSRR
ncbi:hypothetical protein [Pollutibacter soli]|uniref:hypothetical protein n=1 Tax=Pollutibacter soli TaxID=3034157 RepID=UPI0030139537